MPHLQANCYRLVNTNGLDIPVFPGYIEGPQESVYLTLKNRYPLCLSDCAFTFIKVSHILAVPISLMNCHILSSQNICLF